MPTQQEAEDAMTTLYREVHIPAFFEKLANDYGIVPRDEAEAIKMLDQAEKLATLQAQTPTKQASLLDRGGAKLDALLKKAGAATPADNREIKTAAANAATKRPDLAAAALTLLASASQAA
jgi:hypothetical protein